VREGAWRISSGILKQLDEIERSKEELRPPGGWSKKLWLIEFSDGTHGALACHPPCARSIHGLAVFRSRAKAERLLYMAALRNQKSLITPYKFVQKTFNEAVYIAKSKPPPIMALILADDIAKPVIFLVK